MVEPSNSHTMEIRNSEQMLAACFRQGGGSADVTVVSSRDLTSNRQIAKWCSIVKSHAQRALSIIDINNDTFEATSETSVSLASVIPASSSGRLNLRTRVEENAIVNESLSERYQIQGLLVLIEVSTKSTSKDKINVRTPPLRKKKRPVTLAAG